MVVLTRAQYESMSRDQLIDELVNNTNEIHVTLASLNSKIDRLTSDLAISRNITDLLRGRVNQLERDQLNSSQYIRREMLEVGPIPLNIGDNDLEVVVTKALSVSGTHVNVNDFHACHRLKRKSQVIIKFKDRKLRDNIMSKRKLIKEKKDDLKKLGLEVLHVNDSMCIENSRLFYKCRQLKRMNELYSTWFLNQTINVRVRENSNITKIYHQDDLDDLLGYCVGDTIVKYFAHATS